MLKAFKFSVIIFMFFKLQINSYICSIYTNHLRWHSFKLIFHPFLYAYSFFDLILEISIIIIPNHVAVVVSYYEVISFKQKLVKKEKVSMKILSVRKHWKIGSIFTKKILLDDFLLCPVNFSYFWALSMYDNLLRVFFSNKVSSLHSYI